MWQDWRLTFRSWLVYAQEDFEKDLNEAEAATSPMDFVEMTTAQHGRSEKLHSILVGLLRNRPLKILRSVEGRNGLEVWRQLSQQMQPRTRARSIALLQAFLAHPPFKKDGVLEQVLGLERLAEEYAQVSKEELSDNTKLSVLLKVVPNNLRQHLQLQMDESADYLSVREKVLAYERTTTSWSSHTVYRELDIKKDEKVDEAVPMEIDRIKGKQKGKGKGKSKSSGKDVKGKGKFKDGGKSKSKDKGKSKDWKTGRCRKRKGQRSAQRHVQAVWQQGALVSRVPSSNFEASCTGLSFDSEYAVVGEWCNWKWRCSSRLTNYVNSCQEGDIPQLGRG